MSQRARNRAAAAAVAALLIGGTLAFGQFSGTFAIFTAETENPNTAANGSWIPAPNTLVSSLLNSTPWSQEHLTWVSGNSAAMPGAAPNPVTGQAMLYADGGTGASASCPAAGNVAYTSFTPSPALTATSTSSDVTGTNLTHWWCFELQSTSTAATTSGNWTSDYIAFPGRRILVPISVVVANGGSGSNRMNSGDTITITFNQNINTPTANHFCGFNNGANDFILIGDTRSSGACNVADAYTIGKITGVTVSANTALTTETTSVAGAVLTVKLTSNNNQTATFGTPVFVSGTGVTAVTGSQTACISAAAPNCTVTPSGNF